MTEDVKNNEQESQPTHPLRTPGAILRDARREKKLEPEDVAKQLRLSVQWIKDIENNDFSRAPAVIYARGYLRAYARLVNVSPDEVVASFESLGLEEAYARDRAEVTVIKHQAVPIISRSTRVIISRRAIRWITSSAFVLLVVLVGVWWQGQKHHGDHQAPVAMQQSDQPKQDLPLQQTATPTATTSTEEAQQAQASDDDDAPPVAKQVKHKSKHAHSNEVDLPAPVQ